MNAVFSLLPSLGSQFNRIFHSADSQAEEIERRAVPIQQEIYAALQTNERDAFDVFDNVPGGLTTEKAVALGRAVLRKDSETVLAILSAEIDEQVKAVALARAEREVAELTPDRV